MPVPSPQPFEEFTLESLCARPGAKWKLFAPDVLPLWVAEMDYPLAEAVKGAIRAQVDCDDLGYLLPEGLPGVREAVAQRMTQKHGYAVEPTEVALLGSTGIGLNLAVRAFSEPGDEVLLLAPLYPPFRRSVENAGRVAVEVELLGGAGGYSIDFAALERAVTARTRMLMLCNPHNPVGRVFTREELTGLAALAERHDLAIVSDELHADLLFDGQHLPIASLGPEVAARTVTLYGPTKTFNIPGLKISFAISQDAERLEQLAAAGAGLAPAPNNLAQAATIGAYTGGDAWLAGVLEHLRANRDYVVERVRRSMPRVKVHSPAATYLAWLDLRAFDLGEKVADTLVERAKVGLNDGADFGAGGHGFVRLNFATSREILGEALTRLERVLG